MEIKVTEFDAALWAKLLIQPGDTPIYDELVAENVLLDMIEEHENPSPLVGKIRDASKRLMTMAAIEDTWVDVGYLVNDGGFPVAEGRAFIAPLGTPPPPAHVTSRFV